jgi:hypothetical protein
MRLKVKSEYIDKLQVGEILEIWLRINTAFVLIIQ